MRAADMFTDRTPPAFSQASIPIPKEFSHADIEIFWKDCVENRLSSYELNGLCFIQE